MPELAKPVLLVYQWCRYATMLLHLPALADASFDSSISYTSYDSMAANILL